MKYGDKMEIIYSILQSIGSGSGKTRMMYKAFLSYSQLKDYLEMLEEKNLVDYGQGSQKYTLTEKGIQFLNAYEKINELILSTDERNVIRRQSSGAEDFIH
jgi:predicted transcriptional regulator